MRNMKLQTTLEILADAAKYDASCASSGAIRRNSIGGRGIGSTEGMGICHSYTPDGRCVSLLKILLTNACIYDCGAASIDCLRTCEGLALLSMKLVQLTLDFYARNYIEGLFLSSCIKSPDHTMGEIVEVARRLRTEHDFRGYIHLKTIPDAAGELLTEAGRYADRLSVNVELPKVESLRKLAPEKNEHTIKLAMGRLRTHIDETKDARRVRASTSLVRKIAAPPFVATGQSTQLIVGADDANDGRSSTWRHIFTARIDSAVFTTQLSVPFPTQASAFRCPRRRYSARAGFIRPIGCCGITGLASMSCCRTNGHILQWKLIRSSLGPLHIPNFFHSTSIAQHAKRCCAFRDLAGAPSTASCARVESVQFAVTISNVSVSRLPRQCRSLCCPIVARGATPSR